MLHSLWNPVFLLLIMMLKCINPELIRVNFGVSGLTITDILSDFPASRCKAFHFQRQRMMMMMMMMFGHLVVITCRL